MWYNTGTTSLYKGSRYGYPVFLCYNVNEETVFDTGILSLCAEDLLAFSSKKLTAPFTFNYPHMSLGGFSSRFLVVF